MPAEQSVTITNLYPLPPTNPGGGNTGNPPDEGGEGEPTPEVPSPMPTPDKPTPETPGGETPGGDVPTDPGAETPGDPTDQQVSTDVPATPEASADVALPATGQSAAGAFNSAAIALLLILAGMGVVAGARQRARRS